MAEEPRVEFHYVKSNYFRVVHADGIVGGTTTRPGVFHMAFYSERPAIPRQVTHPILPDGTLGAELVEERVTRDGIVRELEADIMLDSQTLKALKTWIDALVEIADSQIVQK